MSKRGTEANKTGSSHHVGDDQSVEQDRKSQMSRRSNKKSNMDTTR